MLPLAFRRLGVGPDVADGDTCRDKLRGVRLAEVRYDECFEGVDTSALLTADIWPS